jgi:endonuclease/exonuclease/phosphatase family metal-dependent hydrolase
MHQAPALLLTLLCCLIFSQASGANEVVGETIRFASFNIAMGLDEQGELTRRLQSGNDEGLRKVAAVIQEVRPDVLLLNEFDFEPDANQGALFLNNYLQISQFGQQPVSYANIISKGVNTGVDSGLDLNNNDVMHEPQDAWGFGHYPYQFGMLVLTNLHVGGTRIFRHFKWADMPDHKQPVNPDGTPFYSADVFKQLRLSSKSHWDLELNTPGKPIHFLVSHPTPPVFDGPEDRNGLRNHDEIRFWADYIEPLRSGYIYSDDHVMGGLTDDAHFVIAGDLNADPVDGDSHINAIGQLLNHPRVNASCVPLSDGAKVAAKLQGGRNLEHRGNPAADTGDFNDEYVGNMRVDYVLPSTGLKTAGCGVFWPAAGQTGHQWVDVSDHRLVWVDIIAD